MELKRTLRQSEVETIAVEIAGLPGVATVVRSARRRRTIAISVEGGVVKLRAPMRVSRGQLVEALRTRRGWILGRLSEPVVAPTPRHFESGDTLPYLGRDLLLEVRETSRKRVVVRLEGENLVVEAPAAASASERADAIRAALVRWYRTEASEVIREAVSRWSANSGLVPKAVLVRDQRRRWGSCGPDGTLRFNWRLVMAELELLEHVVVHELVHLRHRHHQPAFWTEVERLLPGHRELRRRLNAIAPNFPV